MKKSIILLIVVTLFCSNTYSQSIDHEQLKSLLKTSTLAVFSAQKLLLSKDKKQVGGNLSKAVFYQLKAIELYKRKDYQETLCYTLISRELSNEIINKEGGNLNPTYKLGNDEIKQKSECKNTTDFIYHVLKVFDNIF